MKSLRDFREKVSKAIKEAYTKPPRPEVETRIRAAKRMTTRDKDLKLD